MRLGGRNTCTHLCWRGRLSRGLWLMTHKDGASVNTWCVRVWRVLIILEGDIKDSSVCAQKWWCSFSLWLKSWVPLQQQKKKRLSQSVSLSVAGWFPPVKTTTPVRPQSDTLVNFTVRLSMMLQWHSIAATVSGQYCSLNPAYRHVAHATMSVYPLVCSIFIESLSNCVLIIDLLIIYQSSC